MNTTQNRYFKILFNLKNSFAQNLEAFMACDVEIFENEFSADYSDFKGWYNRKFVKFGERTSSKFNFSSLETYFDTLKVTTEQQALAEAIPATTQARKLFKM